LVGIAAIRFADDIALQGRFALLDMPRSSQTHHPGRIAVVAIGIHVLDQIGLQFTPVLNTASPLNYKVAVNRFPRSDLEAWSQAFLLWQQQLVFDGAVVPLTEQCSPLNYVSVWLSTAIDNQIQSTVRILHDGNMRHRKLGVFGNSFSFLRWERSQVDGIPICVT
jgi:hypothetical protein